MSISPAGNEPLNQLWDEEAGEFVPDRSMIPLILVPTVMHGGDEVDPSEVEGREWVRVGTDGSETQVTDSMAGHTLYPTGYPLGLKLTGNNGTGQVARYIFRVRARGVAGFCTVTLRTNTGAAAKPGVELDCPSAVAWDPFVTTRDRLVITPTVKARGKTVSVQWRKIENGTRRVISATDPADAEMSVDLTTGALTIDRRVMGRGVAVVCELYMIRTGTTPVLVDEKTVKVVRRIPEYRVEVKAGQYFSGDDGTVRAEAVVRKHPVGVVADPSAELLLEWYDGTRKVGEGNWHDYPVRGRESADIGLEEPRDRGPWCLATDGDGAYLTDGDGALLLIR